MNNYLAALISPSWCLQPLGKRRLGYQETEKNEGPFKKSGLVPEAHGRKGHL